MLINIIMCIVAIFFMIEIESYEHDIKIDF